MIKFLVSLVASFLFIAQAQASDCAGTIEYVFGDFIKKEVVKGKTACGHLNERGRYCWFLPRSSELPWLAGGYVKKLPPVGEEIEVVVMIHEATKWENCKYANGKTFQATIAGQNYFIFEPFEN